MSSAKYLKVISIVIFSWLGVSCSEDDSSPAKSRDIKFEVTGNFTGALSATYVNATGGGTNESIPALPWNKTITYASRFPARGFRLARQAVWPDKLLELKSLLEEF